MIGFGVLSVHCHPRSPGDRILSTNRFTGDSHNTFSRLSESWQYFLRNYLNGDASNAFPHLSTDDSIFNQIIYRGCCRGILTHVNQKATFKSE